MAAFSFYRYHRRYGTTKHTVMFTLIESLPIACDIWRSFPFNCIYNPVLYFQCHSCFKSILKMGTFQEYAEMHLILYEAYGNGAKVTEVTSA
jgi:hypothetical protein